MFTAIPIIERTTSTIITLEMAATAVAGGQATSATFGPPAGFRWLVQYLGVAINFTAAPAAGDRAAMLMQVMRVAVAYEVLGVEVDDPFGLEPLSRGEGCLFIIDDTMGFRIVTDADASSVGAAGLGNVIAMEYEPF